MNAAAIYRTLIESYGKPRWWSDDPFTVMFQAVLVQNTSWGNVERTCQAIVHLIDPESILKMDEEALMEMIRPCGFYRAKSKTIRSLADWYHAEKDSIHDSSTKALRTELLAMKGIGEETADAILVYGFHRPMFIIDKYTRRFLKRLGFSFADDAERRAFFRETLPDDAEIAGHLHWLLLEHCIQRCRSTPLCQGCPFALSCRKGAER